MAADGAGILDLDNTLFRNYIFYSTLMIAKMVFMSFWTARHRIPNKAFPAPEDYRGEKDAEKKARTVCEPVERVRKAFLNDMENIIPFVFMGFFYLFIKPSPDTALLHFRIFAGARIAHSISYLNAIPQPSRALSCMVGYCVNLSMIGQVLAYAYTGAYY